MDANQAMHKGIESTVIRIRSYGRKRWGVFNGSRMVYDTPSIYDACAWKAQLRRLESRATADQLPGPPDRQDH